MQKGAAYSLIRLGNLIQCINNDWSRKRTRFPFSIFFLETFIEDIHRKISHPFKYLCHIEKFLFQIWRYQSTREDQW